MCHATKVQQKLLLLKMKGHQSSSQRAGFCNISEEKLIFYFAFVQEGAVGSCSSFEFQNLHKVRQNSYGLYSLMKSVKKNVSKY